MFKSMRILRLWHRGSALLVSLVITVLVTIMAVLFLEKILFLFRATGGMEQSAMAYVLATSQIEEQLMGDAVTKKSPWNIEEAEKGNFNFNDTGSYLTASTGGSIIPLPLKWSSPFDESWNIISLGEPVQIVIPQWIDWSKVNFHFRVPSWLGYTDTWSHTSASSSGIILWTFWSSSKTLYASGETNLFRGSDISDAWKTIISLWDGITKGFTHEWTGTGFSDFYKGDDPYVPGKFCENYNCTLKLSMIRPFLTQWGYIFPMLEYKINFSDTNPSIPSQLMHIESTGYVRWYLRSRQVRIPQITTSTAIDFTVLQ